MFNRSTQLIKVDDGIEIAAVIHGNPSSPYRIALIHSLGMDHSFWTSVIELLGSEASIVAIDARGHGLSGKPAGDFSVDRMATDLLQVLDHVGWSSAFIAGASMGGCVALQFSASYPSRTSGLGLLDTTAWYGPDAEKSWMARAERALKVGLQEMVEFQTTRWFSDEFRVLNPDTVKQCVEIFLKNDVNGFASSCRMLGRFDGRSLLREIAVRTAVVVGEQDYAAPVSMATELHHGISDSSLLIIPSARHLTPIERPDIIAGVLLGLAKPTASVS